MKKKETYETVPDGWFEVARRGNKIACCDCHLVHTVDVRVTDVEGRLLPKIEMRMRRDGRATGAMRRPLKFSAESED